MTEKPKAGMAIERNLMAKKKCKRFLIAFDNHGDMQDDGAVAAFFEFMDYWKPELRIHGGDCYDLRALRQGASADEKQEGIAADVEKGNDFMRRFNPHVFLLGNHDHRIHRYIQFGRNDILRQYLGLVWDQIRDTIPECQIIPWGKRVGVYQLGDYRVVHGYSAGMYAAKRHAEVYGNVIMGHIHAPTFFRVSSIDGANGYSSGCLCRLEMDYNAGHLNTIRQAHGFVYGHVSPEGKTTCYAASDMGDGEWILPHGFSQMGGK